jgi:hypothetical protein
MPQIQRTVLFYDDEVIAVQDEESQAIYLPITRMCDNLGVERYRQARRIREHPVLSKGVATLMIETSGGVQEAQCLRLDLLPLWLAGVNANRVSEAIRDKLIRYQTEVAGVLWAAFKPQILSDEIDLPTTAQESASLAQLQQIAEMGRAITAMAEQQMEIQRQQQVLTARLDRAGMVVKGIQHHVGEIEVRLGVIEEKLHPGAFITQEQANEVSLKVKALAEFLTTKDHGKIHYQTIFAELYRRYGVSSYKIIRQDQYDAVMQLLDDWRAAAAGGQGVDAPEGKQ